MRGPRRLRAALGAAAGTLLGVLTVLVVALPSSPASATTVIGAVGPYSFSTAKTAGQAGTCTYRVGSLSSISVVPPAAKMRAQWNSSFFNQYVLYSQKLYTLQSNGSWLYVAGTSKYFSVSYSKWTRAPKLAAFTPTNAAIKAGDTFYRVTESLQWVRPTDNKIEGGATVQLTAYWDGDRWLASCRGVPVTVTGVTHTSTASTVTLNWTPPTSGYRTIVVRYLAGTAWPTSPTQGSAATWSSSTPTTATLSNLTPGATYGVGIWTQDSYGHYSREVHLGVVAIPLPVTSPSATPSSNSVQLDWANPTDSTFTGVQICRGATATEAESCSDSLTTTNATATQYIDSAVQPGTSYVYALIAQYGTVQAAPVTIGATTGAHPVSAVTATPSSSSVQLNWNIPTDSTFTGVTICRGATVTAATDCTQQITDTNDTATQYTDSTVQPGTSYVYALIAHDGTVQATPVTIATTTSANPVSGVTATPSSSSVQLNWNIPTDSTFTGVTICRGATVTAATDCTQQITDTNNTATQYTDSTVQPGTSYVYALIAHDGTVQATPVTIATTTSANPVSGVTATPSSSSVQLSWTKPSDSTFTGVQICRGATAAEAESCSDSLTTTNATDAQYTDSTVQSGTTYVYALIAHDGSVAASPVDVSASTDPGPVTNVQATPASDSVALSWTDPSDPNFVGVTVCRTDPSVTPAQPSDCTPLTTTATGGYSDTGLTASTAYLYTMWAHDTDGHYSDSATVQVTTTAGP